MSFTSSIPGESVLENSAAFNSIDGTGCRDEVYLQYCFSWFLLRDQRRKWSHLELPVALSK